MASIFYRHGYTPVAAEPPQTSAARLPAKPPIGPATTNAAKVYFAVWCRRRAAAGRGAPGRVPGVAAPATAPAPRHSSADPRMLTAQRRCRRFCVCGGPPPPAVSGEPCSTATSKTALPAAPATSAAKEFGVGRCRSPLPGPCGRHPAAAELPHTELRAPAAGAGEESAEAHPCFRGPPLHHRVHLGSRSVLGVATRCACGRVVLDLNANTRFQTSSA